MIWLLIVILLLGTVAGSNGQCDGKKMNLTLGNGIISSPNYPEEYGKSANCAWDFNPLEGYTLELTITYQRLYISVTETSVKICLGSYLLSISNDTQECSRYIDKNYLMTLIGVQHFDYFDSMCGENAENKPSVHVQYMSDGRIYTGTNTVITKSMGFSIQYKFSECYTTAETTTEYVQTSIFEGSSNIEQTITNFEDNRTLSTIDTAGETDGANSDGIGDTAKLFLVSISGFIGIIILVATVIVFCRKRGDIYQKNKNVKQDNVGGNKMENAESPIQEPDQDTATAENDEPANLTIQDEEAPYTIMYSALTRQDEEDVKENSAIEEDEQKHDMYSVVVRKTGGGDKETIHV
ncbi:uncharacterized protein LOC144424234 [Styela clava]